MSEKELDVTKIVPREKHTTIFKTFEDLAKGESFILINDHDPRPLRYQFEHERAGTYDWEYVEQGPQMWRVRLTKTN